ncbi:MAG: glycosyltransferase, partial [Methanoculleaceae archaeon]
PSNITFLGSISEDELVDLYSRCKRLMWRAKDEDFGMTPLEVMASSKPVVAVDEGEFRECIVNGKTSYLLDANIKDFLGGVRKVSANSERFKKLVVQQQRLCYPKLCLHFITPPPPYRPQNPLRREAARSEVRWG